MKMNFREDPVNDFVKNYIRHDIESTNQQK